jgi:hypothetical protein
MSDKRNTWVYKANNDVATIEAAIAQLTAKGRETMDAVGRGWTSFFDNGIVEYSGIWGDNLTGELGHKSSGVINQLVKLGLFYSTPMGEDDPSNWYSLTALGADVANYLAENLEVEDAEPAADADPQVTVKTGSKWTYIYAADGSLLAEIRNDAAWLLDSAVMAACTK